MQCNCNCRNSLLVSEQNCTDADKVLAMANKCLFCSDTTKRSSQHMSQVLPGLSGTMDMYKAWAPISLQKYLISL